MLLASVAVWALQPFLPSVAGVTTTITGMESLPVVRQNLAIAKGFQPLQPHQMQEIVAAVKPVAGDGRFELYKTSIQAHLELAVDVAKHVGGSSPFKQ